MTACWQESYTGGSKAKRILLPVRHLREWIEHNILLELATAPFSKEDATLVPEAGSCLECPKRTGHNTLLFEGIAAQHDSCSDPACYAAKVDAHVKQTVAAKPKLVQITTAYGKPAEGSAVVPRNQYVEIRQEKPKNKYQQDAPEYKTCKFVTEAIVADGSEKGEIRKVCANPDCPVHHPKKQQRRADPDAATKAAQEKQRREEAIANTTGIRVLAAIADAVPVRLMKRDLLFVVERLAGLVEERRLEVVARQHGIKREKDSDSIAKLFATYLRRAEESVLGSVLVELDHPAHRRPPADDAGVERSRRAVQGGHRRHRCEGQAGIRGEGQGESSEEGRAQATSQATGKDREEARSGLIFNPTGTLVRGL